MTLHVRSNETAQIPAHERIHTVRAIFEEEGFGNVELLEGWDGEDTQELFALLTDEEFQAQKAKLLA